MTLVTTEDTPKVLHFMGVRPVLGDYGKGAGAKIGLGIIMYKLCAGGGLQQLCAGELDNHSSSHMALATIFFWPASICTQEQKRSERL